MVLSFMKFLASGARLAALPVALAAAFPSFAQTQLKDVVVTANRSEQLLTEAIPHTTVIGRDVIERSQAIDLPSLLSSEAGFQFTQNGGRGTSANLFLRGSASIQVLVLIDGVPLTRQDTTGTVALEHLFGLHKVGFGQLEAGSYGSVRASAGLSGQAGDTRFSLGVGRHKTDGFSSMDVTQFPAENPDADGYRNTNYNFAMSHELVKGNTLGLRAQGSDGTFEFDGGGFGTGTDVYTGRNKQDTWSIFSHNQITRDWRSELTFSHGHERSIYDATLTASPYDSEAVTRSRTLNWTNNVVFGSWLGTAGAEHQRQVIDATDSFATQLNRERGVRALFAGLSGSVGAHSVQLNVRRDAAEGLAAKATGYAGYGFQLTPDWKLIGSASSAFNLPPLGYLYDLYSGNPALQHETARSAELGVQWAQGGQVVRATVFKTHISNLLQYDFSTFTFNNVTNASNKGLEVSYSRTLLTKVLASG